MSEDVDCLTQLEDAVRAALEANATLAKRVLGPEQFPVKAAHLPALAVDIGDESAPTYLGNEGGDRLIERTVQVDVLVILDAGIADFSRLARALANQVRAILSGPHVLGLPIDDFKLVGAKPQTFASEAGSQGGFHLAFVATFITGEATPDRFEPLNDTSELV
ncbi:hypothetical protein [Methylobacterium iners]|uniref:Gene transfer agent protein n=1 Tax=Methylobacterium iners TaxID=418707 RepID=A0ABQ4S2W9_9HYPH|nr:hypothetical protein [Methylobacterium iners]GJD97478.1 hypothetical protein OCOJLMKI_4709 [Methylobacterium iners]